MRLHEWIFWCVCNRLILVIIFSILFNIVNYWFFSSFSFCFSLLYFYFVCRCMCDHKEIIFKRRKIFSLFYKNQFYFTFSGFKTGAFDLYTYTYVSRFLSRIRATRKSLCYFRWRVLHSFLIFRRFIFRPRITIELQLQLAKWSFKPDAFAAHRTTISPDLTAKLCDSARLYP